MLFERSLGGDVPPINLLTTRLLGALVRLVLYPPRMDSASPKFLSKILVGVLLGVCCGLLFQDACSPLGEVGALYIRLIKTVATPLLFFAVIEGVLATPIALRSVLPLIFICTCNALLAVTIGLSMAAYFHPGTALMFSKDAVDTSAFADFHQAPLSFISFIDKLIPSNFIEPFTSNNVLTLVLMAVLIAAAIRSLPSSYSEVVKAASNCAHGGFVISERLITMLVALTPIAVFCVIAKVVGLTGFQHVVGLLNYLGVCLGALLLQIVIVYQFWIVMVVGMPLRLFWKASLTPALYAFSINSSLAALPETLRALSHLGASKESARLAACIGTNLNNDGILLYETLAIIIIAQALGIELTFAEQLSTALLCIVVSLGMSGIPEAGIIGLTLILTTLKLPSEMLPLLLTVDWIIARMRSATNVIADITTGLVLNSYQNRRAPTIGT